MNCSKCGYDMSGLDSPKRCPECGDADWQQTPAARWSGAEWVNLAASAVPLATIALLHLMLVVARLQLGHWPNRWGRDDPKNIPLVSELHSLAGCFMLLGIPIAFLVSVTVIVGLFINAVTTHRSKRAAISALLIGGGLWASSLAILRLDPTQVVLWFFD